MEALPTEYLRIADKLDSPERIQAFIDGLRFYHGPRDMSVREVLDAGTANCFGASNLAAYCLKRHGYKAYLLGLIPDWKIDCGHQLAVYEVDGLLGSITKCGTNSRDSGIGGRSCVYRTVRELAMSYYDFHRNSKGVKSLRAYTDPADPDEIDKRRGWVYGSANLIDKRMTGRNSMGKW